MPIYVEQLTPRQIADIVVERVLDASIANHDQPVEVQQNALSEAVLEALKDCGIELLLIADSVN